MKKAGHISNGYGTESGVKKTGCSTTCSISSIWTAMTCAGFR
jgi:hypothetical protein